MKPLSDGPYQLYPMADVVRDNGSLVLYRAQTGAAVASLELGYQPLSLIEVRDDVYLVAQNDGSVVEVTREGEKLRVSHEAVSLGHGVTAVLSAAGPGRAALITDDDVTTTLTVFDTSSFEVLESRSLDPQLRANPHHAVHAGVLWTTLTDFHTGGAMLVGIDLETLEIADRLPLTGTPQGIVVDEEGMLWVADSQNDLVRVIDPTTVTVIDTIELPQGDEEEYPIGLAADGASGAIAVSLAHLMVGRSAVVVIDQDTRTVETITPISGDYPSAIGYDTLGNIWSSNIRHAHGQHDGGSISVIGSTTRN